MKLKSQRSGNSDPEVRSDSDILALSTPSGMPSSKRGSNTEVRSIARQQKTDSRLQVSIFF